MKNLTVKQIDRPNYSFITGIFLLLITMASLKAYSQAADSSKVWFTPNLASVDMLDLFNQPEQWDSARSKVDVFKFYTVQVGTGGWGCVGHPAYNCGDNHIENFVNVEAFSKLGDWEIDIAVESFFAGPIMSYDPIECSTAEYVHNLTLDGSINVIQSIEANGGVVRYLAMDEPIRQWYSLYHYIYFGQTDPRPCLVDSLGELADHVTAYIHQMQIWFPSVSIGHIELYPEVGVDQFKEWIIALEARGVSLSFLHIDVHGPRVDQYISFGINIDVAADMAELKSFCNEHDIEFGIIFFDTYYDSQYWNPDEYNDSTYYAGTMNWVNFVHDANLQPDHNIFQSWVFPYYTTGIGPNEIPVNLPENDSYMYSHTRLINKGYNVLNSPPVILPDPLTALSKNYVLHQNYPNPFNSETTISFTIPEDNNIELVIFDIIGQKIITLLNNKFIKGKHSVVWDGTNNSGEPVDSGIYFCKLSIDNKLVTTKKIIYNF
ncbi:MAG: T9SS type A sorting domain-containing protein [Bacteroidales bacterium]|nr:T9SS type A sorting domain-containing protein [Bacteroidales bacterium]